MLLQILISLSILATAVPDRQHHRTLHKVREKSTEADCASSTHENRIARNVDVYPLAWKEHDEDTTGENAIHILFYIFETTVFKRCVSGDSVCAFSFYQIGI